MIEKNEKKHIDLPRIPENAELFKPNIPLMDFEEDEKKLIEEDPLYHHWL